MARGDGRDDRRLRCDCGEGQVEGGRAAFEAEAADRWWDRGWPRGGWRRRSKLGSDFENCSGGLLGAGDRSKDWPGSDFENCCGGLLGADGRCEDWFGIDFGNCCGGLSFWISFDSRALPGST